MKYLAGISIGTTALALVCSAPSTARSQDFPNRVVTITIPYAPGGSAEGSLRPVADALSKTWKQPVIIESKGGGGTTIGAGYIAEQTPDGYRLLFTALSAHTIAPNMFGGLKYDAVKSFTPISGVATSPYLILVNAASPVRTIAELVAHAKANPGKVNYGSSGAGTGPHLAGEILKQDVGIETVHVSFRGAAPAIAALLGSHIDYLVTDISGLPLVQAGQLRAVAVTSLERSPYLPETPTVHETVDKGFEGINRVALMGPAGMDPKLTATIMDAVHKALATDEVKKVYQPLGYTPSPLTREQLGRSMQSDSDKFAQIIRKVGVKAE
jgi:tripartite-type tricarboxylate transporter receptor subunit TctC